MPLPASVWWRLGYPQSRVGSLLRAVDRTQPHSAPSVGSTVREHPKTETAMSLEKILSTTAGIAVCWLGNLSWLIYAERRLVAFDLDLDWEQRISKSPIATEEIAPALDAHFITHEHGDHFSEITSGKLAKGSDCLFVVPANCVEKARRLGIADARIHIARPGEPFDLPGVHVTPLRALHGHHYSSVYRHANLDDCGYLFTMGGKTFLQPGDTVLLHEHLELTDVDMLFVSPTIHNMHIDHSAILINTLEPEYIFPQHFGTYVENDDNRFWTKGYPDELKTVLPKPMQARFHKLEMGEVFVFS
jgi:L-ascorbate 6-phosphate lactonase